MYGTAIKELDRIKGENKIPVLDIDVQGATKVKDKSIESVFIFVLPCKDLEQAKDVLKSRLEGRGTETPEQIEKRVNGSTKEIELYQASSFFTHTLINEDLEVSWISNIANYMSLDHHR